MNGPPSSGQQVNAGSRSSLTSCVTRFGDGSRRHAACSHLEQLEADVACAPELCRRRRHDRLDQLHDSSNQAQRPLAERHLGPPGGPEQIGDEAEVGSLDVGKEQRRSAARDDAPMDLRDFEMWIDLRLHRDEVIVTAKLVEKGAEVGEGQGLGCRAWSLLSPSASALGP